MFKKVLVTGSSGTLGMGLKMSTNEYPGREFIFTRSTDCDLRDPKATLEFVRKHQPDAILHLAAVAGGIPLSMKHPAMMLRDNTYMTFSVLEAARALNIKKTLMTLTTGMYPPEAPLPIKEESIHDGAPHSSNYGSSFAKRLIEPAIRSYREEYKLNVIGVVPNGILGEYANYHPDAAIMPAALIKRFYENKNGNEPLVIWGDGSPLREITYAKDMARAFMWCLDNYNDAQILNVGTTEEVTVKDIALMIAEILGIDKKRLVFDTTKPAGVFRKGTDNSRFIKLSNFKYTPLRQTLEHTIKFFLEHHAKELDKAGVVRETVHQ